MRKLMAVVLLVAVLLSNAMLSLNFVSAADNADLALDFAEVSFDGASAQFYQGASQYAYLSYENTGDVEHGMAFKFTTIANSWGDRWPEAFRIGHTDGSGAFLVEKGAEYRISYEYMNERATSARSHIISVIPATSGIGQLGTLQTRIDEGTAFSVGWVDRGNSKEWKTYSSTFVAPCDGSLAFSIIKGDNMNVKYQKIWFDNFVIEKIVSYDGSTVDVSYDYNDGSAPQVATKYAGHSYGYPTREGYVFEGWYVDAACTVAAPSTVRPSCTKVYAKWAVDTRVPQHIVNTYDEEGITFIPDATGDGITNIKFGTLTQADDFATGKIKIATTTGADGKETTAMNFTGVGKYSSQWPAMMRVYDMQNTENSRFYPNAGSAYEISIKYRVDKKPSNALIFQVERVAFGIGNPNGAYNTNNIYLTELVKIDDVTDGWATAKGIFYTKDTTALTITLVSATENTPTDVDVYIDDVEIKERLDVYSIHFETNGGDDMTPVNCISDTQIPVFSVPTRSGYYFNGWYTDAALTKPFQCGLMTAAPMTLYADWTPVAAEPKSLITSFEADEYNEKIYTNDGGSAAVSDNTMTSSVVLVNDVNEAFEGSCYLRMDDGLTLTDSKSDRWMAVSLYNPDGTPFQILAGCRYRISIAYRTDGTSSTQQFIGVVVTDQSPAVGINAGNTTALLNTALVGPDKHEAYEWGEYQQYVIPEVSGVVKLVMYGDASNHALDVDNVKIELLDETECVKVDYYHCDQNGENIRLQNTRLGAPGDLLIAGDSSSVAGYDFDGWRDEEGNPYDSNKFPSADLKLYSSWKAAEDNSNAEIDWSEDLVIDFEDTHNAKAFYEDAKNNYHPSNGVFLMVDDPDGAHSGNNYFQYYQCGHWMNQYLRSMKFYTPESVGNQVYLEPNSVYRVSFWMNVQEISAGNLYLVVFDGKETRSKYEIAQENYLTETNQFENYNQWKLYENTVVTGEDLDGDGVAGTLGFVLYGGYLTAKVDDITVTKLKEVTISFDSNGGSDVNDVVQLSHDLVFAPADPERSGYDFTGWYTDAALTEKFDFKNTKVTSDLTLYAGWKEKAVPDPVYETIVEYNEIEKEVPVEPADAYLDAKITVNNNDKINTSGSNGPEENSVNIWLTVAIIAGGVVLVAAAATVFIIFAKKKRNKV